jgi:hypothetical protein
MRTFLAATATLLLIGTAAGAAAEFWETRPFLQWTDKEAQKVMTDSPWAVLMAAALPPPLPREGGAPNAQGGGRGGDDGFGAGPRRVQMQIVWRSALPIRQAFMRSQIGPGGTLTAQQQEFIGRDPDAYVIAISNLPIQYARGTIEAFLKRKGRDPIPAAEAGAEKSATGPVVLIGFPRTDPITVEEGDVELTFKADRFEFKRKFTLKNMMFGGKLEL